MLDARYAALGASVPRGVLLVKCSVPEINRLSHGCLQEGQQKHELLCFLKPSTGTVTGTWC